MREAATEFVTIRPDLHTVIIQFEVAADDGESFVHDLTEAVSKTVVELPGFRSAVFQLSTDHTLVVNYAQWDSAEIYKRSMASIEPDTDLISEVVAHHGAQVAHIDAYDIVASFLASS